MVENFTIRVAPEMKRNVARLNGRKCRQPLIVMGPCHIIHLRRIQRLHPNVLDNALNHHPGLILFILRRTRARFHTKKQMMVLDPLEFAGVLVCQGL